MGNGKLYLSWLIINCTTYFTSNWDFSAIFVLVPYVINTIILLKHIDKWNNLSFYISYYIERFDAFLIGVTIISEFCTSIELARSKNVLYGQILFDIKLSRLSKCSRLYLNMQIFLSDLVYCCFDLNINYS